MYKYTHVLVVVIESYTCRCIPYEEILYNAAIRLVYTISNSGGCMLNFGKIAL